MPRTNELDQEVKEQKRRDIISQAALGGLERAVERSGGQLQGISFKVGDWDVLGTLRADFPGGAMVAFVGGSSMGAVLHKAMQAGNRDELRWREDEYRN